MYYNFNRKKIPTPLALLFLLMIVLSVSFLARRVNRVAIQARKLPVELLKVTNITYNSATIFWRSQKKEVGWIIYGEEKNNLNQTRFDDRDLEKQKNNYFNHYMTLDFLKENTKYFFKIANSKGLLGNVGNIPFELVTQLKFTLTTNVKPAFGRVLNKNGAPVTDGIVVLTMAGASPLSTLTKNTGEWLIPLYYLTKEGEMGLFLPKPETAVTIEIINEDGLTSQIKTTFASVSPLPQTVILGENYDFKGENINVLSQTDNRLSSGKDLEIIFPKEGATIPGRIPLFKGTALPGKKVTLFITIGRNTRSFEITTKKDGIWEFTPFFEFQPGKYKTTVTTKNESGKEIKQERAFTIAKSGEAVLGEATPSATVAVTPTLPSPSPTATVVPTATPPVTGINFTPLVVSSSALIILGIGLLMIF